MKSYPAPPIPDHALSQVRELAQSGVDQEEIIGRMRALNLGIVPSIHLLAQLRGLSIADAKRAVHFSPAWSDCRTANDNLHDVAAQAAQSLDIQTQELKTA